MREEHSATEEDMGAVASQLFKPIQQLSIDPSRSKLINKFIIINCLLLSIAGNRSMYVPGGDYLFVCSRLIG